MGSSNATMSCSWSGFSDAESGVDYFEYAVGYHRGDQSVRSFVRLPNTASSVTVSGLDFDTSRKIYVTVKATNLVGLFSVGFSNVVQVDTTPPVKGAVQVLSDVGRIDYSGMEIPERYAGGCVTLRDYLRVKWSGFQDEESSISKYEVGVGRTKGMNDVQRFISLSTNVTDYTFSPLDLSGLDRIYVTVRAFNGLQLFSAVTSEEIRVAPAVQAMDDFIHDGSNRASDLEYQNLVHSLTTVWYSGDVCAAETTEWKIERADGRELQAFSAVDPDASGYYTASNNQLSLDDGKTYRVVAKSTDVAGRTRVLKSNGVTVNTKPLRPGTVRDGTMPGNDIGFQMSGKSISANWDSFGDGSASQTIKYYEVAVGVDRRYPATRSSVVPFVSVGMNTTYTFKNLRLVARTVRYYVTVRAHSVSGATVETTSDGLYVGYVEGIVAGKVTLDRFQTSTTDITAHWSVFEAENPIERYDFAAGTVKANETTLLSYCDDSDAKYSSQFDVAAFQSASTDTSVTLTGVTLQHGQEYFVTVRAVDRAGHCVCAVSERGVVIDTTSPQDGQLRVGFDAEVVDSSSGNDKDLQFSSDSSHVTVSWWSFEDGESDIESYTIGLYRRSDCDDNSSVQSLTDAERASQVVADIIVLATVEARQSYTFSGLNLSSSAAYVVRVVVRNKAGLKLVRYSQPVRIDTRNPIGGDVRDGSDWASDRVYQSSTDRIDGIITHSLVKPWYNGEISESPCPSVRYYSLDGPHSDWSILQQIGSDFFLSLWLNCSVML